MQHSSSVSPGTLHERLVLGLVAFCMTMNFALALVNNLVVGIRSVHVILIQALATAAALVLALARRPVITADQATLGLVLFLLAAAAALRHGQIDPKVLYDMTVVPIFVLLGTTLPAFPRRFVNCLLAVVLLSGAVEYLAPEAYARVVNPLSYYLNTRDWVASALADGAGADEPGFYIGASRPGEEAIHRVGGIFLEPIAFGYFGCVLAAYYMREIRTFPARSLTMGACCVLLPILADVRIALAVVVAIIVLSPLLALTPSVIGLFAPVAVIALGWAFFSLSQQGGGDVALRLSWTYDVLRTADLATWLLGGFDQTHANDSGVLYFGNVVGLAGVLIYLWLCAGLFSIQDERILAHALLIYMAATCLFSHAFVSIKTGAFHGLMVGSLTVAMRRGGGTRAVSPQIIGCPIYMAEPPRPI